MQRKAKLLRGRQTSSWPKRCVRRNAECELLCRMGHDMSNLHALTNCTNTSDRGTKRKIYNKAWVQEAPNTRQTRETALTYPKCNAVDEEADLAVISVIHATKYISDFPPLPSIGAPTTTKRCRCVIMDFNQSAAIHSPRVPVVSAVQIHVHNS